MHPPQPLLQSLSTDNTLATMSEELNSLPPEAGQEVSSQVAHHRRRRRSHPSRESDFRGRLWLILIFLALRGIEVFMYLAVPARNNSQLLGSMLSTVIWTTALLIGIWYRQNWCRYILIVLLLLTVVVFMILVPEGMVIFGDDMLLVLFGGLALAYAAIAWVLISSRDIRRLTNRTDDWKQTLSRM